MKLKSGEVATPIVAHGQMINCKIDREDRGVEYRMIGEVDCVDRRDFWENWKNSGGQTFVLDDGSVWDPSTG